MGRRSLRALDAPAERVLGGALGRAGSARVAAVAVVVALVAVVAVADQLPSTE